MLPFQAFYSASQVVSVIIIECLRVSVTNHRKAGVNSKQTLDHVTYATVIKCLCRRKRLVSRAYFLSK